MSVSVKYFTSGMTGAPQVDNAWGDLVALLDACLVHGFGLKAIDSLTCVDGLATAHIASGHGYQIHQVVAIAGADQPEYNGEFRVTGVSANSFTYELPSSESAPAPASPATSVTTLTAKVAPLNWDKPFSGTHRGAYRSKNVASPQNLLLVDDSLKVPDYDTNWAKWAAVGIAEDMSDIDTIIGAQAPFDPNRPTRNWKRSQAPNTLDWGWHKWYHARGAPYETNGIANGARNWVLVGDDRMFYLMCTVHPSYSWYGRNFYCFGDIASFKPGDQYATALAAHDSSHRDNYFTYPDQYGGISPLGTLDVSGNVLLRNHTQLGHPVRWGLTSLNTNNAQQWCGRGGVPFPNGADYSLWLLPAYVRQEDGHMRGTMPGMLWMPQDRPYSDQTIVDNVVGQAGKRFLLVRTNYSSDSEGCQVAFDITGPWS